MLTMLGMTVEVASAKGRKDFATGLGQVGTLGRGLRQITLDSGQSKIHKITDQIQAGKIVPKI